MPRRIKHVLQLAALGIAFVTQYAHSGMTTPGQFAVSPSGAATYSIPIQVPPGAAGIEPKLALTYNSQAGNGLLGVGWSLSGLSAITRCPRTMAQDGVRGSVNYDTNDRYCLDGQRLMALPNQVNGANGTEYRTELEGFAKIVSYGSAGNGPAWFKVWTKAGQVMEYGNTMDSKVEAIKVSGTTTTWPSGTVRQWAINKISDTKGNFLTVSYTNQGDVGALYPQKIAYTSNDNANTASNSSVQFEYESTSRPDVISSFYLGSVTTTTKRLSHIKTFAGTSTTPIKDYGLSYTTGEKTGRSKLTSISECDAQATCLASISLGWLDGPRAGFSSPKVASWASGGTPSDRWFMMLDVNGDGKSDALLYEPVSGNLVVGLSNGNGGFSPTATTYFGTGGPPSDRWFTMADVNGDGLPDAVRYEPANGFIYVALGVGNGGFSPAVSTYLSSGGSPSDRWFMMVDVNGDGKADAVRYEPSNGNLFVALSTGNGGFSSSPITTYFGTGGTPSDRWFMMLDVNGDGKVDALSYEPNSGNLRVALGTGNGDFAPSVSTSFASGGSPSDRWFTMEDVNGDGLPDAVLYEPSNGNLTVALSLGNGYFGTRVSSYFGSGGTTSDRWFTMADVNGDGRSDAICYVPASGAIVVAFVGAGGTFNTPITTTGHGTGGSPSDRWFMVADVNGDGLPDAVRYEPNGGNIVMSSASPPIPDVISTINTGLLSTAVVTQPLTSALVYTKDTGPNSSTSIVDLQLPMYVVSSVTSANGVGGSLTTTYTYGGLKAEMGTGRGLLGFRWMKSVQQDSGISSYSEFRQDYPYTGLPTLTKKTIAGGGNNGLLNQISTQYDCLDPATGNACTIVPGHRYFPYAKTGTESSWDVDGSALPTIVTAGQYDIWGNAKQITVTTSDGYSKSTVNTYADPDLTNWYLGRLTKATVTSTAP